MTYNKNFNSNACNIMYLRTKKMYLYGYKMGKNISEWITNNFNHRS